MPRGNEHATRVTVSVVRRPHMTSAQELLGRRLLLPALLVGLLPTTAWAQRFTARLEAGLPPDTAAALVGGLLARSAPAPCTAAVE
ncbi:hypothetical protein [Saccharopolyspora hordei]|uniref:Uncharacterized protein n=1 Tax=Saccharopolyspora hordei TaxID=1838 RepID=A0A853AKN3_9PSEU|nr:hypothetical protein [Saccharopolyspora hordei]NYI84645.1 hypothetical protein [Saccharopolyspora hordei]